MYVITYRILEEKKGLKNPEAIWIRKKKKKGFEKYYFIYLKILILFYVCKRT